jgi:hypothetical protein
METAAANKPFLEKTPKKNMKEPDQHLLAGFIKEDREEIRMIKSRIYTNIQVLIAVSLAVTSFFIERSMNEGIINLTCSVKKIIIVVNILFLTISWIFFYFQNKDLHFVRKCLSKREKMLKDLGVDYFEDECETSPEKIWEKFLNKFWKTDFKNDGLLFIPMCLLSFIYIGVMILVLVI